jgi:hypothetical protein
LNCFYQPTSWEYIQFLYLANNKQNAFLANEGDYMLEAWLNTGMAAPYIMASAIWTNASGCAYPPVQVTDLISTDYYSTLQEGYDNAGDGDFIRSHDAAFNEIQVDFDDDKTVTLVGGYDCSYSTITGNTTLNGDLVINGGTVTIENLIVQ